MSYQTCKEVFLKDVISVAVYRAADCHIELPPIVPIKSLSFDVPTESPVIQFHISDIDGFILMSEHPTLKISNTRSVAGNIYTHDLQIPILMGRDEAESAITQLQCGDFYILYQNRDGSRTISYTLPNTSVADIDESISPNLSVNVKLKVQSMSPLINIV